jgi:hypothetical protein
MRSDAAAASNTCAGPACEVRQHPCDGREPDDDHDPLEESVSATDHIPPATV